MSAVVFLDVDGVLNTRTTCERTPSYYTGIDDSRVEILSRAMRANGFDGVVLTTTWKALSPDDDDYKYLSEKLSKFKVNIIGKTKEEFVTRRADGILKYLEEHTEIDEYVILDDQTFSYEDHVKLWENFLHTGSKGGIERAATASDTPTVTAMLFLSDIKRYI